MRWIYLSPHFDDAVLSCGGLIWEQTQGGAHVEIWTVCAGDPAPGTLSPLAEECHHQWGIKSAQEVVKVRRIENQKAAKVVEADTLNFSFADCIYRRSPTGEWLYPVEVFVPLDSSEKTMVTEIAKALSAELLLDDVVISPLAIGGHLDHVMVRDSAELLNRPVWFYSDIPYLFNYPDVPTNSIRGLKERFFPISKEGMDAWQRAISAYTSQISMLFKTKESMQEAILLYWKKKFGIYLWKSG